MACRNECKECWGTPVGTQDALRSGSGHLPDMKKRLGDSAVVFIFTRKIRQKSAVVFIFHSVFRSGRGHLPDMKKW